MFMCLCARVRVQDKISLPHNSPVYSGGQTQSQVEGSCVPPFMQFFVTQSVDLIEDKHFINMLRSEWSE